MLWAKKILGTAVVAIGTAAQAVPVSPDVHVATPPAASLHKVAADPVVSLLDGRTTHNLQIAHFNAIRSLSLTGFGGLTNLAASGIIASEGYDFATPSSENAGVAPFQNQVIDGLIGNITGLSAMVSNEFVLTDSAPLYDPNAVITSILQTDPNEWGDQWVDAVTEGALDAANLADPSDVVLDAHEVGELAELTGSSSPLTSDFGMNDGGVYSGGHLADLGHTGSASRSFGSTAMDSPDSGTEMPRHRHARELSARQTTPTVASAVTGGNFNFTFPSPVPLVTVATAANSTSNAGGTSSGSTANSNTSIEGASAGTTDNTAAPSNTGTKATRSENTTLNSSSTSSGPSSSVSSTTVDDPAGTVTSSGGTPSSTPVVSNPIAGDANGSSSSGSTGSAASGSSNSPVAAATTVPLPPGAYAAAFTLAGLAAARRFSRPRAV